MGRPLDSQSKVFGLFKIFDLYILIGFFLLGLMFMPALLKVFRFGIALGLFGGAMILLIVYFVVSNGFPDRFFLNWLLFSQETQNHYPGRQKPGIEAKQ